MEPFRTVIQPQKSKLTINYSDRLMLLGSCFSDNIGALLRQFKFRVLNNPFGVIYNPESIANSVKLLISGNPMTADELFFENDLWGSYKFHTTFSGLDKTAVLDRMNSTILEGHQHLTKSNYLFLTLGTSWIYERKDTLEVVANCHKSPANFFNRRLLNIHEIVKSQFEMIEKLRHINPGVKIIYTVSPVRHWKDGAIDNQRSKARLLLAVETLAQQFDDIFYFPSYELVMDDLRDYRFYKSDMLHINEQAVEYIWEFLKKTWIDENANKWMQEIDKISKNLNHKPLQPDSPAYRKLLQLTQIKIGEVLKQFPELDFIAELDFIKSKNQ